MRRFLPHLTDYLASGERRFAGWYATLKTVEVAFEDQAEAFESIKTRAELQASPEKCGETRDHALIWLANLEAATRTG
jgi:molybdopterin-guanine dinucleotide biosynthesis protein A